MNDVAFNDVWRFDPGDNTWTNLSMSCSGRPPSKRIFMGVTAAYGRLYIFGGVVSQGVHFEDNSLICSMFKIAGQRWAEKVGRCRCRGGKRSFPIGLRYVDLVRAECTYGFEFKCETKILVRIHINRT